MANDNSIYVYKTLCEMSVRCPLLFVPRGTKILNTQEREGEHTHTGGTNIFTLRGGANIFTKRGEKLFYIVEGGGKKIYEAVVAMMMLMKRWI